MLKTVIATILLSASCHVLLSQVREYPARSDDSISPDLFLMTLGNVQTPLAQGVFDPAADVLRLSNGTVLRHYYRDSLHIKFYTPIDKSVFSLPPSGWCSWYFYYQQFGQEDIRENAKWIAGNLKDFGADVVQIDDGWQGTGHGMGENRDWSTIDRRFPEGMDKLAGFIRSLGLRAGLWLAPHGQSNADVVRSNPGAFLLGANDTSVSNTWEGTYLVDPSAPEAHAYLSRLFTTLSRWGYDYFKIDGQPIVIDEYRRKQLYMKRPSDNGDSLYRITLATIRHSIGPKRYLLGCWGIPLEGIGLMNGSRTGGDVELGWSGFLEALHTTMDHYFLHNVVWYCDPDVMLVRAPLTLDQARAWATLQGLTGQALMSSDRLADLSPDRVEILKRVYPAADIRPLDLFPSGTNKHIWDLKVHQLERSFDVVGIFNFDESRTETRFLSWSELGLSDTALVHVFDFWNKEYLGSWEKGLAFTLPPASCRVVSLTVAENHPQLVSTSRHVTQGWIELESLSFDPKTNSITGRSRVVKNDPYELRFAYPRGEGFRIASAVAGDLPVRIANHQGWGTFEFTGPKNGSVDWQVKFAGTPYYRYETYRPYGLSVDRVGLDGIDARWSANYYLYVGTAVSVNGALTGYSSQTCFPLRHLHPDSTYTVSLRNVWQDGRRSKEEARVTFSIGSTLPESLWLSEIPPLKSTAGWGSVQVDKSVSKRTLSIGGKRFERGIGTHADSEILFAVDGLYETFSATVGLDDNNGNVGAGSVEFTVVGDGQELWRSGVMKRADGAKQFQVHINGVRSLLLKVGNAGDGIDYDHADWAEARLSGLRAVRSAK